MDGHSQRGLGRRGHGRGRRHGRRHRDGNPDSFRSVVTCISRFNILRSIPRRELRRRISTSRVRISMPGRRSIRITPLVKHVRCFGTTGNCNFIGSASGNRGCFFRVSSTPTAVTRNSEIAFRVRHNVHKVGTMQVSVIAR